MNPVQFKHRLAEIRIHMTHASRSEAYSQLAVEALQGSGPYQEAMVNMASVAATLALTYAMRDIGATALCLSQV